MTSARRLVVERGPPTLFRPLGLSFKPSTALIAANLFRPKTVGLFVSEALFRRPFLRSFLMSQGYQHEGNLTSFTVQNVPLVSSRNLLAAGHSSGMCARALGQVVASKWEAPRMVNSAGGSVDVA